MDFIFRNIRIFSFTKYVLLIFFEIFFFLSDVPDSAMILRKHELSSNLFSCLMFNELEAFNPRDQLAFAYVRDHMKPKLKLNMFEVEVFEQVALEYRHNLKHIGGTGGREEGSKRSKTKRTKRAGSGLLYVNGSCCSKCQKYLLEMWGESHKWFCPGSIFWKCGMNPINDFVSKTLY